jgi:hypothetical protein
VRPKSSASPARYGPGIQPNRIRAFQLRTTRSEE